MPSLVYSSSADKLKPFLPFLTYHMNIQEVITRAHNSGSSANTLKGAVKYLVKIHKLARPLIGLIRLDKGELFSCNSGYAVWKSKEAERKSNPEAKRAAKDKIFRRKFLRRISDKLHTLLNPALNTIDQVSAAAASRANRQIQVNELITAKNTVRRKPQPIPNVPSVSAGIKVHSFSAEFAKKMGAYICMAGKEATLISCREPSRGTHVAATPSVYRNGGWRGFERCQHDNYVRSFGLISTKNSAVLDYIFHETRLQLILPDGVHWAEDSHGLKAVWGPDDYHPTAQELLSKNAAEFIVGKIIANAETRAKLAAEKLVEAAEAEGVFVCVADSLRAGNCRAGTEGFAARHGLSITRHYHAPELLNMANGDIGRVRVAVRSAMNRHKAEMERGYGLLSEHRIPVYTK